MVRLTRYPLTLMLLLSGALHLSLLLGWPASAALPGVVGTPELKVSLRAAPTASRAAEEAIASGEQAPQVDDSASQSIATQVPAQASMATKEPVMPQPEPTRQLADKPAPDPRPAAPAPAKPEPARPDPAPEPPTAPLHEPDHEPETEDPFEELLSDQQEVVASTQKVAAPVAREPQWRRPPQPPVYPALARRRGQEGEVMLRLDIDARGAVTRARVLTSSGFPLLDRAAQQAGLGWELVPARIDGIAVASYVTIPVQFRLQ